MQIRRNANGEECETREGVEIMKKSKKRVEEDRSSHRIMLQSWLRVFNSLYSSANTRVSLISCLVSHLHLICIIQVMCVAACSEHRDLCITFSLQPLRRGVGDEEGAWEGVGGNEGWCSTQSTPRRRLHLRQEIGKSGRR